MVKTIITVVLIAGGVILWQGWFHRSRINNITQAALPDLPDNCVKAYDTFDAVYKIGNARSLGGMKDAERTFYHAMTERTIGRIINGDPKDSGFFYRIAEIMEVMQRGRREHAAPTERHQMAILKALADNRPGLAGRLGLGAWDYLLKALSDMKARGLVADAYAGQLDELLMAFNAEDRTAIAARECFELARDSFQAGVTALGAPASLTPDEPFLAPMAAKPSDKAFIEADKAFVEGISHCARFKSIFPAAPQPERLAATSAKLTLNLAIARTMHLLVFPPQKQLAGPSDYFVKLYVAHRNDSELPTEGEMLGAFIGAVGDGYDKALNEIAAGALTGEERTAALALAHWSNARFARAIGRTPPPQSAQGYQDARSEAARTAGGSALINRIESTEALCLIVR